MSFLARRKHRPDANRLTVFDETADDSHASIKSTSSFRRRLSSLSVLSSKLARSRTTSQTSTVTKSGGIAFTASYSGPYESYASHSRSPSPEPSLEIRRPSGLGRRASLTSEQWWSSVDANAPAIPTPSDRKRSISTPELSLPLTLPDGLPRWSVPSETDDEDEEETRPEPVCMVSRLSPALLKSVFGFVPRSDLPSVALACKAFLEPTRTLLYSDVDLMPTDETHSEQCMTLLASRRDLAGVVQRFSCNVVPSSSSTSGVVPLPAVTFAIAVSNMRELTSLTLPQFDAALLHHATFHLTSLAFLCQSSSRAELQNTFAWLAKQPNITSLSFSNLVLDDDANQWLAGSSGQLMCIPEDRNPSRPATPVFHATLLPRLAHLSGPTSLVSALTPGRPLSSLAVSIQRTIYDGLRPSALAAELARGVCPVTHLCVLASAQSRIDARTFERVLMAMGSELGSGVDVLEVECALDDQVSRVAHQNCFSTQTCTGSSQANSRNPTSLSKTTHSPPSTERLPRAIRQPSSYTLDCDRHVIFHTNFDTAVAYDAHDALSKSCEHRPACAHAGASTARTVEQAMSTVALRALHLRRVLEDLGRPGRPHLHLHRHHQIPSTMIPPTSPTRLP